MGLDVLATVAAVLFAFLVRFAMEGTGVPLEPAIAFIGSLHYIIAVRLLIYNMMGLYSQVWGYAVRAQICGVNSVVA